MTNQNLNDAIKALQSYLNNISENDYDLYDIIFGIVSGLSLIQKDLPEYAQHDLKGAWEAARSLAAKRDH